MSITERAKDMGVEELVKENKRLKNDLMQDMKEITKLEEENKKLKEEVRFLEECLDRKEKLNVGYRKENKNLKSELSKYKKYYDRDKEELMESCYSLARENDELKKQIENLNGIAKMLI
jgi:predicted RNase H-like nuclease (RuvC/YqgF family)